MQRRTFLKTTAALAAVPPVEATAGGIPAPFDAMPTLEDPPERVRELAQVSLPPRAVPDDGPIPEYHHQHTVTREITLPAWALEAARWRLVEHHDTADFLGEMFAGAYPSGVVLEYHGLQLMSRHYEDGPRVWDIHAENDAHIETINLGAFQTISDLEEFLNELVAYDPDDREEWVSR